MSDIMTLKDLADYLRMNERTIAKLVQEGKIPGFKVASQWRFSKEAIDSWFKSQMQTMGVVPETNEARPRVASLLAPEVVNLNLASRTKDGILVEMTDLLVKAGKIKDSGVLLAALRERERLYSTGIGRGIAFLHPRRAIAEIVSEPVLALGRSTEGVPFDAVDGQPVHLFFLDCTPSERVHLALLARMSRLLADDLLLRELRTGGDTDSILTAIRVSEGRHVER